MAGVYFRFNSGEVSLSAGVAKTVLQLLAAANHRIVLGKMGVYFKGTVVTDTPVLCQILRQSTAGTMSAGNIFKNNDADDETIQTSCTKDASAEPTAGDILEQFEVHPQTGYVEFPPPKYEWVSKGGGRIAVKMTAAQNQTVIVSGCGEE